MSDIKVGFSTITPSSGTGDMELTIKADKHTGRSMRTTDVLVENLDKTVSDSFRIDQNPSDEYSSIEGSMSIPSIGGDGQIVGKSNSSKLTFSFDNTGIENVLELGTILKYKIGDTDIDNGQLIPGDPGTENEFEFIIDIIGVPENSTFNNLSTVLTIEDASGKIIRYNITQLSPAFIPYIEVDKTIINLDVNGTAQTIKISSNTSWRITLVSAT